MKLYKGSKMKIFKNKQNEYLIEDGNEFDVTTIEDDATIFPNGKYPNPKNSINKLGLGKFVAIKVENPSREKSRFTNLELTPDQATGILIALKELNNFGDWLDHYSDEEQDAYFDLPNSVYKCLEEIAGH